MEKKKKPGEGEEGAGLAGGTDVTAEAAKRVSDHCDVFLMNYFE